MSSDYERYIRTDALLSLQKSRAEQVNHDELLFQVTHQSSELWMKAVLQDLTESTRLLRVAAGEAQEPAGPATDAALRYPALPRAVHLVRRSACILGLVAGQELMLEWMNPADYHQIRLALGRGSGQDSPGFNRIIQAAQPLTEAYRALFAAREATPMSILQDPYGQGELHSLVQALLDLDEQFGRFRQNHLSLVRRQIGLDVLSLKGIPANKLVASSQGVMFKDLWSAVSDLTNSLNPSY